MLEQTREPQRTVAGAELAGRSCPYCRFPLKEGGEVCVCGECRAAHHADCWADNGGCAVVSCAGGSGKQTNSPLVQPAFHAVAANVAWGAGKSGPAGSPLPPPRGPQMPPPPTVIADRQPRSRGLSLSMALVVLAVAISAGAAALIITKSSSKTTITQAASTGKQPASGQPSNGADNASSPQGAASWSRFTSVGSVATAGGSFHSPSGNVSCSLKGDGATCSVASISESFVLPQGGGAAYTEAGTVVRQGSGALAPYGTSVSSRPVPCAVPPESASRGITCSNADSGHGFQASRVASRQETH